MSTKADNWKKKLPTLLTFCRIFAAPLVIGSLYLPIASAHLISAIVFILASLTDWWDGKLARYYQVESDVGRLMDPIADKVLVSTVLIMLAYLHWIDPFVVMLLITRDLIIGGIRSIAANQNLVIAAKPTGKWKTAIQMVAIPAILFHASFGPIPVARIGYILLWVSVALSLISAVEYLSIYRKASPH